MPPQTAQPLSQINLSLIVKVNVIANANIMPMQLLIVDYIVQAGRQPVPRPDQARPGQANWSYLITPPFGCGWKEGSVVLIDLLLPFLSLPPA